jgi:hypothetical protein
MERDIFCIYDIRLVGKSAWGMPEYSMGGKPLWVMDSEILNAIESSSLGRIQHDGTNVSIIPTGIIVTSKEEPVTNASKKSGKPLTTWELDFKLMHQITKLDEVGQLCDLLDGTAVFNGLRGADFQIEIRGLELFDYPESEMLQ